MEMIKKNKGILVAIIIFIAVIVVYNMFFKSETLALPSELSASSIGDDLIGLREKLQVVTLDQSIFASTGYLLLIDFSTVIAPQPLGRSNPFDIIGRD